MKKKRSPAAGSAKGTPANWDDKIEQHLRANLRANWPTLSGP